MKVRNDFIGLNDKAALPFLTSPVHDRTTAHSDILEEDAAPTHDGKLDTRQWRRAQRDGRRRLTPRSKPLSGSPERQSAERSATRRKHHVRNEKIRVGRRGATQRPAVVTTRQTDHIWSLSDPLDDRQPPSAQHRNFFADHFLSMLPAQVLVNCETDSQCGVVQAAK